LTLEGFIQLYDISDRCEKYIPLVGTWIRPSFPDLHMVYSMIARIQTVSGTLFDKFVEWIRPTSPPVVGILDTVIEDLATAAERAHPNETVLLLKTTKLAELSLAPEPVDEFDTARIVTGFHVPPRMKQSPTRAAFDQTSLPTSMGIGGVAHSHPNGVVNRVRQTEIRVLHLVIRTS
jgi:hypothetical protein